MKSLATENNPDQRTPIHSLLAQASALAQELTKVRASELGRLRDQAQDLVHNLDTQHPALSAMEQALGLVRKVANSSSQDISSLREEAQRLPMPAHSGSRGRRRAVPASSRDADAWVLEMFRATESAIPREALVEEFIARYRRERRVEDTERHRGPWLVMLEAETVRGEVVAVRPLVGAGLHPAAFAQRCMEHLPNWRDDPFIAPVVEAQADIDGWYALTFGGSAFFDAVLDVRRHMAGESDYWINAVALPSDGRYYGRAVFTLYRNLGDSLYPEPPSIMRQDMRLLTVLALAWRQLEHQVLALARFSEADRRDMINLIAPGLLHHEIGYNMRTAYGQAREEFYLLRQIAEETNNPKIDLAALYAHGVAELALHLYAITDAFNNLDKRAQVEESNLNQVFAQLKLLLNNRLGHAKTELVWNAEQFAAQRIQSDVVLLSQALMNILTNALNALVEGNIPAPRRIQVLIEREDSTQLTLNLINNGPVIPPREAKEIFRRGYTTRRQGHGQGLYLARLIAHYLGGELTLMEPTTLPAGFFTGFQFSLDRRPQAVEEIARETI